MELRQGPLGLPVRHAADRLDAPAGPRRRRRAAGGALAGGAARCGRGLRRAKAASACSSAAGSRSRTPTHTGSSPGSRCAPTTSTSAPGRTRRRRPTSSPQHVVATGPDGGAVTYADLEDAKAVLLVGFEPEDESTDRLPAAPQGRAPQQDAGVCGRPLRVARPRQARGPAAADPSRQRDHGVARPRRLQGRPRRAGGAAGRRRRPRRRTARHGARRPDGGRRPRGERPAPGWRGSRGGRASAVRSRPARCGELLPGGRPAATPPARDRGRRGLGRRRAARHGGPRHRRHHRGGLLRRDRRARHRRRRPGRPQPTPASRRPCAKTFVVSLESATPR